MNRRASSRPNGSRWAIVLAGGEGERMRPFISRWLGTALPKQYCTFVGKRSMLQHTVDRAGRLVDSSRILTAIGPGHCALAHQALGHSSPCHLIEQPCNFDTGPGIFLPAYYVRATDPDATLLIFPSDHYVFPEARFLQYVAHAAQIAERFVNHIVLLGASPRRAEPDYGWIKAGELVDDEDDFGGRKINAFREKPTKDEAEQFQRRGWLCNTLVMAVKARTLWALGHAFASKMLDEFEGFAGCGDLECLPFENSAFGDLYARLGPVNFSTRILERAVAQTLVLPMPDVEWSDWGRPARVAESLAGIGKKPNFPLDCLDDSIPLCCGSFTA